MAHLRPASARRRESIRMMHSVLIFLACFVPGFIAGFAVRAVWWPEPPKPPTATDRALGHR